MPAKGSSSGRVSGSRGGGGSQSWGGAAKSAWKQLPGKAKKQIVQGTAFNVGVAGAASTGFRKSKAASNNLGAEGPKKSSPRKRKSR